jgi:hypothetical protein
VGFLDDDPGKTGGEFYGVPVLGPLDRVAELIAEKNIDQVYIALPLEAHKKMLRILQSVGRECVEIRLVPDVLQYATLKASLEDLDGTPVINLSQVPLQGWSSLGKRVMDIGVAATAMLVLLPAFPIVALVLWLEDHGPLFYRQERMGLDGRPFMMIKFRSMRVNAEASTGPVWAIKDDPRRTNVGSTAHQRRHFSPPLVVGRVAAAVECPPRRHVDHRAPTRTAGFCARVQAQDPAVHVASSGQVGNHRLGTGPRLAGQHLDP